MNKFEKYFRIAFTALGVMCLWSLIIGLPLWILWNLVMHDVFGLPHISFWQAVGIQLIASLLFKSNTTINKTK